MKKEFAKSFNTADFQCMITGEEVAYARKNKDAVTKKWTTNFLLCGNEYADWASTSGSMERRIMPFEWPYRLKKADTRLYDRIMRNMGPFIRKANCCYHTKVTLYGDVDITGDTHVLTQQMNLFLEKMNDTTNRKQGGYGRVKIHKHSKVLQLMRLSEVAAAVNLLYVNPLTSNLSEVSGRFDPEALAFCDSMLGKVSRR